MVRLRFVRIVTYPPGIKYKELLEELEEKAKKKDSEFGATHDNRMSYHVNPVR